MWLFIVLKYIIKNITQDEAGCATRQRAECGATGMRACERCETRLERQRAVACACTDTVSQRSKDPVKAHYTMGKSQQKKNSSFPTLYMASARRRHKAALAACSAFTAGAGQSAAARS